MKAALYESDITPPLGCHQDTVSLKPFGYCGDFSGEVSKHLKEKFGPGFISIYLASPSGDINHIDMFSDENLSHKEIGKKLSDAIVGISDNFADHGQYDMGTFVLDAMGRNFFLDLEANGFNSVDESREITDITEVALAELEAGLCDIIVGKKSIDEYDSIIKQAKENGYDRYLEINQIAYDRYLSKKNK